MYWWKFEYYYNVIFEGNLYGGKGGNVICEKNGSWHLEEVSGAKKLFQI